MAYTPHTLVAFSGSWLGDTIERWENTVRLSNDGGGGSTLDQAAYMLDIKAALLAWFTAATSWMSNKALIDTLKVNAIGEDGKYASSTLTNVTAYTPTAGAVAPSQDGIMSCCYSWHTANVRGPAHHGRIYPPNPTKSLVTAFRISAADATAHATAGKALLTVLRNSAGVAGRQGTPVIASKIGGAMNAITGVSSDDVYDVQRRRKNRISPTSSAILAFP